jgi:NADPH:quinone reductase-like Zn-dependent oxidoreductase
MKAILRHTYGSADVLEFGDVDQPAIGPGEVLVRVRAAGVDRGVWHVMTGLPYLGRLAFGLRTPRNPVLGMDVSGLVEAVGEEVTTLRPGNEVFGTCNGAFAEYTAVREERCAPKPAGLTFEQAAALPTSGVTALQAVRKQGRVRAGQRVLVIGAGGGVGSYAVQIAKASGAHVTGVCSTGKVDLVRSLGADHVVDYRLDDDLAAGERRYDVILDTGGNRPLRTLRRALAPTGTLVLVGAETGGRWLGGTGRQLRAMALNPFTGQRLVSFIASENAADLLALTELVESGAVTPAVDRTFPLAEAPAAVRYLREGHARGKVVVDV